MSLFSLQGYFNIAPILASGAIGPLRWLGNVPEATLNLGAESVDKTESYTGKRLQVGRLTTSVTASLNLTMDEWSAANLALAYQANVASIAAAAVTGEVFPDALVAGDLVRLDHPFASALVLTDSTATPVTVPAASYALEGHGKNRVRIIDPGAYSQPFKAAYSYESAQNLALFSQLGVPVYLQFDGIETETNQPVLMEFWRVRFDPVSEVSLINPEYGNLPLAGAVLYDPSKDADPLLGGFGRLLQKAPVA